MIYNSTTNIVQYDTDSDQPSIVTNDTLLSGFITLNNTKRSDSNLLVLPSVMADKTTTSFLKNQTLVTGQNSPTTNPIDSIPTIQTHPLLGFTFCLISAVFIGLSFIFQRKANLLNNDEENNKKSKNEADQMNVHDNDAYIDVDHEVPIVQETIRSQKYSKSNTIQNLLDYLKTKNYVFLQSVWWIGIGSLIVGEFLQIFAYKFATTTLIAPLGAMRVISTAMFSRWYLKERVTKIQLSGIATSMFGSILLILCAPRVEEAKSVGDILLQASLMFNAFFVLLILYTTVVGVKLFQLAQNSAVQAKKSEEKIVNPITEKIFRKYKFQFFLIFANLTQFTFSSSLKESIPITDLQKTIALFSVLQTCALGTISVLSTKLLTMLDLTSISLVNFVVYMLLIITCPLQIYYVNVALKYEQASRVMPLKYAGGNILIMIGSVMLFHEWEFLTVVQIFGMMAGLVVAIGGIYMVVKD